MPCDPRAYGWPHHPGESAARRVLRTRRERSRPLAPDSRRTSGTSPAILVGRGVRAIWMGVAHGVGWVVRGVGRQAATARDLDPEHRRDGAGLLLLGLAILTGVAVWLSGAGPVGERVADTVRLFLGAIAAALPLLLLFAAIRLMRDAGDPEHRGRGVVGWSALSSPRPACSTSPRIRSTTPSATTRAG